MTEGLLLPKLLQDPELAGVSAIIFDEFHERNLNAELCLAHIIHNQSIGIRSDLKIIVMSATLELTKLSSFLAPCAHLNAEGRHYPVAIHYAGASSGRTLAPMWERAQMHSNVLSRRAFRVMCLFLCRVFMRFIAVYVAGVCAGSA